LSKQNLTIKPNNHRIHPCPNNRKIELIKNIISRHNNKNIVLVSSNSNDMLKENIDAPNVSILSDKEFITNEDLSCELLISYDLADSAEIYVARVAKVNKMAVVLLDLNESTKLYPIETLLGRVLKEEIIEGYEPIKEKTKTYKPAVKKISQQQIKEIAKKRYEEKTFDKPKKEFDEQKKDFKKSSGKFGDKEKKESSYKKPKKVGKKITIKERKKPS